MPDERTAARLHADHTGDLAGMLLYGWGVRVGAHGPLAPIRAYGPPRPDVVPAGDAVFHRETTIYPGARHQHRLVAVRYLGTHLPCQHSPVCSTLSRTPWANDSER